MSLLSLGCLLSLHGVLLIPTLVQNQLGAISVWAVAYPYTINSKIGFEMISLHERGSKGCLQLSPRHWMLPVVSWSTVTSIYLAMQSPGRKDVYTNCHSWNSCSMKISQVEFEASSFSSGSTSSTWDFCGVFPVIFYAFCFRNSHLGNTMLIWRFITLETN